MSRNGFPECEREYNRREEEIEMAKEERKEPAMSDSPRTDEVWRSMHGSGYQMMLLAEKLERELAELQNAFEDAMTAREQAEARAAALEEALSQMLDDMGADGFCVCPAAKEQAIAAMGGQDDT